MSAIALGQVVPDGDERWDAGFFSSFGCNGTVITVEKGPGTTVFLGGSFTSCGDVPSKYVAAYDIATQTFSTLNNSQGLSVNGLVEVLYWASNRLYVGGRFTEAGGSAASSIAIWTPDNNTWHSAGLGLTSDQYWPEVKSMTEYGGELVIGGRFTQAGGQAANNIASLSLNLDNPVWSAFDDDNLQGTDGIVYDLQVIGGDLYVASTWNAIGTPATSQKVAMWDGMSWQALPNMPNLDAVEALESFGGDLYVTGPNQLLTRFNLADGSQTWDTLTGSGRTLHAVPEGLYISGFYSRIGANQARYIAYGELIASGADEGQMNWMPLLGAQGEGVNTAPLMVESIDDQIWLVGYVHQADDLIVNDIVIWDPIGSQFQSVGSGQGLGLSGEVSSLLMDGTDLYAGGSFYVAGEAAAGVVARLSNGQWTGLGKINIGPVRAIQRWNDNLYIGGIFSAPDEPNTFFRQFDSVADEWNAVTGLDAAMVYDLIEYDGELLVAGQFVKVNDQDQIGLATWDGAQWGRLGNSALNNTVYSMAVSNSDLYLGGLFTQVTDTLNTPHIVRFDGQQWSALGSGLNERVRALVIMNGELYAGGQFTATGDDTQALNHIARWDGNTWHPLGAGLNGPVWALATDGTFIYATGEFTESNGTSLAYVAKWDGTNWQSMGEGLGLTHFTKGYALAVGPVGEVYVGGQVMEAGGKVAANLARYNVPACEPGTYSDSGYAPCQACPTGQFASSSGMVSCELCPLGREPNETASGCVLCAAGSFSPGEGTVCSKCPEGEAQSAEGATSCVKCLAGEYQDEVGQAACKDCPAGTANDQSGAVVCEACAPGSYTSQPKQSSCTACELGREATDPGATACTLCEPGTYSDEPGLAECKSCGAAEIATLPGATACVDCAAGREADEARTNCVACPAGQFSDQAGTPCQDCAAGTFASLEGSVQCMSCSVGQYQPGEGQSVCLDCAAGTEGSDDRTACVACPVGTFSDEPGQACQDCPVGKIATTQGQTSCTLCEIGQFQPQTGQSACLDCVAGKQGTEDRSACENCQAGTASLAGQGCVACAAGTYQDKEGQATCTNCSEGQYQPETGKIACLECAAGTFNDQPGMSTCQACQPGSFSPVTGAVACLDCEPGTHASDLGATECLLCDGNTDTGEAPGAAACISKIIFIDRFQQGAWFLPKPRCLQSELPS